MQISVDTYLFSGQYTDLATLSVLSKYTSGSTYYYPAFLAQRDSKCLFLFFLLQVFVGWFGLLQHVLQYLIIFILLAVYYSSFLLPFLSGAKYEHELHHNLVRATAFEAVMRVRATRGIRFSNFYGNYFIRGAYVFAVIVL